MCLNTITAISYGNAYYSADSTLVYGCSEHAVCTAHRPQHLHAEVLHLHAEVLHLHLWLLDYLCWPQLSSHWEHISLSNTCDLPV